jgi:hypothetical protein
LICLLAIRTKFRDDESGIQESGQTFNVNGLAGGNEK